MALSRWTGSLPDIEPLITTVLYFCGAVAGVLNLRRNKIASLLGPSDYVLDDYAFEKDFVDDWRKLSQARLMQMSGFFVLMLCFRFGALFVTEQPVFGKSTEVFACDVATLAAFIGMAVCYCAACYCVLHITAGSVPPASRR